MSKTLDELAQHVDGKVSGDKTCIIESVESLRHAGAGQISYFFNSRMRHLLRQTSASAVILAEEDLEFFSGNAIIVHHPRLAYARIATLIHPHVYPDAGIDPSAAVHPDSQIHETASIAANCVIASDVEIAAGVEIGPGCVIGSGVSIGEYSILVANVTVLYECHIGKRDLLQPGVVIGGDGFGFVNDNDGAWIKIPQLGRVILGDDVELGSNTTIDRGAIQDTVIDNGVKLDNLIQVAHNVRIGAHTAIAAYTGVAGSTKIGKYCVIAGGVGIAGHLEIVDHVTITGGSTVLQSIKQPGIYSSGAPLEMNKSWHKNYARIKQLDVMARRIRVLELHINNQNDRLNKVKG